MKRTLCARLAVASLLWVAASAHAQELVNTRLERITDPLRSEFPSDRPAALPQEMRGAILKAIASKGWALEAETPDRMQLVITVRNRHTAHVELFPDAHGFTIRYLASTLLYYEPAALTRDGGTTRAIHRNYNQWIRFLALAINAELGVANATLLVVPPSSLPAIGAVTIPATPITMVRPAPAAAASAAPPSAVPVTVAVGAQAMPGVGAKWKYEVRDQQFRTQAQFFTVEVTEVRGTTVGELFTVDGGDTARALVDVRDPRFMVRPITGSITVLELAPYSAEARTSSPSKYPEPSNLPWTIEIPAYASEEITVPAGTFKTVRVEVRGTAQMFGWAAQSQPARFIYTVWYAPQVNRYVRIRNQTWNRWNTPTGDEVVRLVGYQAGK